MKGRIYVAGPMSGKPLFNWPMFEHTTRVLRRMDWDVVSPTEIDESMDVVKVVRLPKDGKILHVEARSSFDYETVLMRDLDAVQTCTHILLLPDWHKSPGARRELAHAMLLGHTVVLYEEVIKP